MSKDKQIEAEFNELMSNFEGLCGADEAIVKRLCEELAFMRIQMAELKEVIKVDGSYRVLPTGNGYEKMDEHPAQKAYNNIYKNYSATISKLKKEYDSISTTSDALMDFLGK